MSELREIGCNECGTAVEGGHPQSNILYSRAVFTVARQSQIHHLNKLGTNFNHKQNISAMVQ